MMSFRRNRFFLAGKNYSMATSLLLATPYLILSTLIFIVPILLVLKESFFAPTLTFEHYERAFSEPVYMRVLLRTLRISFFVTAFTFVLAWPVAWVMSQARGARLAIFLAAILMPLWTSVLVRTYAWVILLQTKGIINQTLQAIGVTDSPIRLLYTEGAVVVAMAHVLLPFMVLPLFATLRSIPEDYARAAQMMGASRLSTFREVILPLSLPGITSGCLMVFLLAVGYFVTPSLVGGPRQTMISTLISQQVLEMVNWPFAGALVGILLVFVSALAALFRRSVRIDRFVGQQ